jgi:hypothetical protein
MQGNAFGAKPLFGIFDEVMIALLKGLGTFVTTTRTFMEQVKVIYKQNGFVASGLSAQIRVAMKPVNFSISM